jgi:uncharacterized protein (DUF362 family)/Pyruvate/2-oxoacid:ferredoxin oxidoreductase delta subunit
MAVTKSKVALAACESYDPDLVEAALRRAVGLVGGAAAFVKPGENILLKPNVLIGSSPDKCVGTHPAVFRAAIKLFREAGAALTCGDSSGAGATAFNMRRAGLKQVAEELGVPLADFSKGRTVPHPDALLYHRFRIAEGVLAADGLVSLSKMKTHGLTRLTGAVKNQFGCVPGLAKAQQHARLPDPRDFATMLVDLNTLLRPRLYVMDAVMAMEGNGPRNGNPRKIGLLLASADPIALDATVARLVAIDPAFVPTAEPGERSGLGTYHAENIEVVGEDPEDFACPDFDVVRRPVESARGGRLRTFAKNRTSPRPVIDEKKCTRCGTCVVHCPVTPKAVDWRDGDRTRPPVHDYGRCIRCFCCQELCPEAAISITQPLLGRVFLR